MLKRIINILQLRREERIPTLAAFVYFVTLNIINVCVYWQAFMDVMGNDLHQFIRKFYLSGFDPLTYGVISDWSPAYNIYRHPLLAFFMYPFYLVNQGLLWLTGYNCATVLTAVILTACSTYSFVFLYRILHNVIGITKTATYALTALYFSFGFIMLTSFAPDHFVMSQCCLLLVLWLSGEKLKRGSALNMWQTIALFTLTAGVSLNNGLKVFLAALMTRRKRFFRPGYLALAVILPSALIWGFARWEYKTWEAPKYRARQEVKARKDKETLDRIRTKVMDTITVKTDSAIEAAVTRANDERLARKQRRWEKSAWYKHTGKPMMKGEFMGWTDVTTSRTDVAVHSLFGEALQLHKDYALGDVLRNRPVIVKYSGPWAVVNYFVEGAVLLLFLVGIWFGRRNRFLWTALSFFGMDMALHMGLGFGINEVFIMSAHYMFVFPITMAYIYKRCKSPILLTGAISLLALWCFVWNLTILIMNW